MKAAYGFIFFMLFLAGIAFVNLRGMQEAGDSRIEAVHQLSDVAWRLTHLGDMVAADDSDIYIQFGDDGGFGGNGGCNQFQGNARFGDGMNLDRVGASRRRCPEPANSLEISFLEALDQTAAAARVDDRLVFKNASGANLLRFVAIPRRDD